MAQITIHFVLYLVDFLQLELTTVEVLSQTTLDNIMKAERKRLWPGTPVLEMGTIWMTNVLQCKVKMWRELGASKGKIEVMKLYSPTSTTAVNCCVVHS